METRSKLLIAGAIIMGSTLLPSIAFANAYKFDDLIKASAKTYKVPFFLVKGVIATESSFNPNAAASSTSARGLMQLTKGAAQDAGTTYDTLFDPYVNIDAGTLYLSMQYKRFGSWEKALIAYYAGAGNVLKAERGEYTQLYKDGQKYAAKVFAYTTAFALDLNSWV